MAVQCQYCNFHFFLERAFMVCPPLPLRPTIPSSVKLLDGLAVVPARQRKGKGRGGNVWLSPAGCAMFTLQLCVPLASRLGRTLPLVQHMAAVAVAQACRSLGGSEVGVKWPNDLLLNRETKLGGVLTLTSCVGSEAICNVGVGLNLDNAAPTISLNSRLRAAGSEAVSRERYLAEVFNRLERLVDSYEAKGAAAFLEAYYEVWIHSGQSVTVRSGGEEEEEPGVVEGVDEFGFLLVRVSSTGQVAAVQPDGNSFDMMRGLIFPKMGR